MANYGTDYTTGRYPPRRGGFQGGYDSAHGASRGRLNEEQAAGWYGWDDDTPGRGGWGAGRGARAGWDDFGPGGGFSELGAMRGSPNRGRGGQEFGAERWRGFDRSGSTGFDRYGSAGYGQSRGVTGYDGGASSETRFGASAYGRGGYEGRGYGSDFRPERGRGGGPSRGYTSRESHSFGPRRNEEYDRDFGDRVREGWHRFRDEARSWMGRGYDRGW